MNRAAQPPRQIAIIGPGRLGTAFADALRDAGDVVKGPLGRHYSPAELAGVEVVLLCVPDGEIAAAAAVLAERLPTGAPARFPAATQHPSARTRDPLPSELPARCPLVGHCSGASTLEVLDAAPAGCERFSLHPLMTFAGGEEASFDGATAAVAGSTPRALETAAQLSRDLGMTPLEVAETDRAAYHAAASIASNFLVALECAAERLAASAGCEREALVPLVQATVRNWAARGEDALTGPIARGDAATVARQREAVAERTPELLGLFDALAQATRELAGGPAGTARELGGTHVAAAREHAGAPANTTRAATRTGAGAPPQTQAVAA